jgi:hypothetical protein
MVSSGVVSLGLALLPVLGLDRMRAVLVVDERRAGHGRGGHARLRLDQARAVLKLALLVCAELLVLHVAESPHRSVVHCGAEQQKLCVCVCVCACAWDASILKG